MTSSASTSGQTKKRVKKPSANQGKFELSEIEYPVVDELSPFHKNPRVGDVDAIAASLDESGQFKPIVVNRGTKTKRKNEILAGNHTWLAARSIGWNNIAAVFVDVDDTAANKIVLADNRTSDQGEYDDELLADLLQSLPDLEGTGYADIDVGEILATLPDNTEIVDAGVGARKHKALPDDPDKLKEEQGAVDPEDLDEDEEHEPARPSAVNVKEKNAEDAEATSIDAQPEILPGQIQVADPNVRFEIEQTPFDIPRLLPGYIPPLPESIDCWAGPAICEDDGEGWWLYNYSSDSTRGLPWNRTFLGFYVFEDRYENWWHHPDKMVTRMLNNGCLQAIMPDFSIIHANPRVEQMYQTYRNFWLGRFMQECGIAVVPNLKVPSRMEDLEWAIAGIPDQPASLALQLQTVVSGKGSDKAQVKRALKIIKEALDIIEPDALMVYASEAGETALDVLRPDCRVVVVPSRRRRWQQSKGDWLGKNLEEERQATKGKKKPIKVARKKRTGKPARESEIAEKRSEKRVAAKRKSR